LKITPEEVIHVAKLARLEIGPDELPKFTSQLDTILAYMDKLRGLNTDGVEPTYHAMKDLVNVMREDKVGETLTLNKVLANAPLKMGNFVKVPRITEEVE
jgi:aspartyl-tRNA(Asn)/glutamyl-tRNA(Gln) amidotransferase subunit C